MIYLSLSTPRKKDLWALGDISKNNIEIFDASAIFKPSHKLSIFPDKEKVVGDFSSIKELKCFLEGDISPIVISPGNDIESQENDLLELLALTERNIYWLNNKITPRYNGRLRMLYERYAFNNKVDNYINLASSPYTIPRNLRTKGFIKVSHKETNYINGGELLQGCDDKTLVYIDSSVPFHRECQIKISPKSFYNDVMKKIETGCKGNKYNRLIFCQHPNSDGQELDFVKGEFDDYVYGKTPSYIKSGASFCGSSSLTFYMVALYGLKGFLFEHGLNDQTDWLNKKTRNLASNLNLYWNDGICDFSPTKRVIQTLDSIYSSNAPSAIEWLNKQAAL